MDITFVRTVGLPDRFYVARPDGSESSWTFPTFGEQVPHDLVHWVVESVFGLSQGFWGRVAEGVDVKRVNDEANRRGGKEKYAGYGDDRHEILLAEALAAAFGGRAVGTNDEEIDRLAEACDAIGVDRVTVTNAQRTTIAEAMAMLQSRWRSLVPKGSMRVQFDPSAPAEGLRSWLAESNGRPERRGDDTSSLRSGADGASLGIAARAARRSNGQGTG